MSWARAGWRGRGQHLSEAYRRSYDAKGMRDASVRVESSKFRKLPHVDEAITKFRAMQEPTERTVEALEGDWVLLRLWEEAVSKSNPASARVRSLEVLGRALGLFDGKREVGVEHRSPEEIRAELHEKLESLVREGILP